ncbi:aldo/keto reductase family protein [Kribbella sp. VKM Ac-2527]|uniref:Aldo/keto reductase family protein n=1 Tax=Kribbella caucasensis TaxID=2512215 RepID=A0A4R6K9C8_9ACTN|nr:aldo/keto reductase [Kribbella sp. VKM Ac-2527]TDO44579.1 aldo/keto reductase family protein [Kribbella sp. VKM Ac-2527]
METRRLGRLGHQSSVLIYGAAALGAVDQDRADASIQEALDAGINHFDVAADYGEAEQRLGPRMGEIRDRIFLATKTGRRTYDEAWSEINRSLERLRTDRIDLIQMHAVCDLENLDLVTGKGGSLEAAIRAKEEGMVAAIGITGHTAQAPAVHTEGLRRFDFDSVLTPLNYRLAKDPQYAADYAALVEAIKASDAALMTIKMIARRNWQEGEEKPYDTWYRPFDEQRYITAATAWLLNGHPEITGLATAGETRLLQQMITAEKERAELSAEDAAAILDEVQDYSSPFVAMPF